MGSSIRSRRLAIHPSALSPTEFDAYLPLLERHDVTLDQDEAETAVRSSLSSSSSSSDVNLMSHLWSRLTKWFGKPVDGHVERQILAFFRDLTIQYDTSSTPHRNEQDALHVMIAMLRLYSHSPSNRFLTRDLAFIQNDEPSTLVEPPLADDPVQLLPPNPCSNPFRSKTSSTPFSPNAAPSPTEPSPSTSTTLPPTASARKLASKAAPPLPPTKRPVAVPLDSEETPKRETNPFRATSGSTHPTPSNATFAGPIQGAPLTPPDSTEGPSDGTETSSTAPPSLPPRKPPAPLDPPPKRQIKKDISQPLATSVAIPSIRSAPPPRRSVSPNLLHGNNSYLASSGTPKPSFLSSSGYNPLPSFAPSDPSTGNKLSSSSRSSITGPLTAKLTGSSHIGLEASVRLLGDDQSSQRRAGGTRMSRSNSAVSNASSSGVGGIGVIVGSFEGGIVYERTRTSPCKGSVSRATSVQPSQANSSSSFKPTHRISRSGGFELESDDDDDDDGRLTVATAPLPTRSTFEIFSKGETIRPEQQKPPPPPKRRVVTAPSRSPFEDDDGHDPFESTPSGSGLNRSRTLPGGQHNRMASSGYEPRSDSGPQRATSLSHRSAQRLTNRANSFAQEGEEWMVRARNEIVRRTSGITSRGSKSRRGDRLVGVRLSDDEEEERRGPFDKGDEPSSNSDIDDDDLKEAPEPPERVKRKTAEDVRREVEREVRKSQEDGGGQWNRLS